MLLKCYPPIVWVNVLIVVFSLVSTSKSAVDFDVDSLIKHLFSNSAHSDHVEYADLKNFVATFTDELFKSNKYDNKCLRSKLAGLPSSTPSQHDDHQHHNESDQKFRQVSSILVASVNSCLSSSKHSHSNDSHAHDHDHHDHSDHESTQPQTEKIEQPTNASKHYSKSVDQSSQAGF